ncbi:unnamed protein product [Rodentolepis nana]|uniref:PID domain-containing protein n=1 Tax=Rodentolepis nana TaxID=102285 RepID=A0A0R3TVX8_RODNA|nr:unnamed protein product [Rodentolepis nana]
MDNSIYKFAVCENLIYLGSLQVISSGDSNEIRNTLVQMVKDHDADIIEGSAPPKPLVCISFFITDESKFSIINQKTEEIIDTFDASKIVYRESKCVRGTHGFVVFVYPHADSVSKQLEYYCYVYQCTSFFESYI